MTTSGACATKLYWNHLGGMVRRAGRSDIV
jgi:hypothetical protein